MYFSSCHVGRLICAPAQDSDDPGSIPCAVKCILICILLRLGGVYGEYGCDVDRLSSLWGFFSKFVSKVCMIRRGVFCFLV